MADETEHVELGRVLSSTHVGDINLSRWPKLEMKCSAADAAANMREQRRGSCVVCHEGRLVGIFTERDLLRMIARGESLDTPLAETMSREPHTVTSAATLLEATRFMNDGGYRRLPVIDASGEPIGILDVKSITNFLVELIPETVYNQVDHAHQIAKSPEGA